MTITNQNIAPWRKTLLLSTVTIQDAAKNLTESAQKISLIVDSKDRLIGTISDGDIRRGLLNGLTLASSIDQIIRRNPLVVPVGMPPDMIRQIMFANKIQQVPEVDEENRIFDLHTWDEFDALKVHDGLMIIMAGGRGTRLRPHTENCPKPMLSVRGKPMLEYIIDQAKAEGFRNFVLSVNYLADQVEGYFGNGSKHDVSIKYLYEDEPLGTAGALSLLPAVPDKPFVVTNGDVITDIRYADLLDFHSRYEASATMAVKLHEWKNPFGVIEMEGLNIVGIEEKPVIQSHVNAGVYALSPDILGYLDKERECDMPNLFERLLAKGERAVAYPMHESWLDVGRPDDLAAANKTG